MEILKRTPRTDMYYDTILAKMAVFYEDLAESEGVEPDLMDRMLTLFARMSVRVKLDKKVDFQLALPGDTPEQVRDKCMKFLDTEHMDLVDRVREELDDSGFRGDPVTAPQPPTEKN